MKRERCFRFIVIFGASVEEPQNPGRRGDPRAACLEDGINNEKVGRAAMEKAQFQNSAGPQCAIYLRAADKAASAGVRRTADSRGDRAASVSYVLALVFDLT